MTENIPFDDSEPKYPQRAEENQNGTPVVMAAVYAGPGQMPNGGEAIMSGVYAGPIMAGGMMGLYGNLNQTGNANSQNETSSVTEKKFCSECGAKLVTNAKFCHECGIPVNSDKMSGGSYV